MPRGQRNSTKKSNGANLGFEATLWAAADKLRNNMDDAEYKHVALGLIFLKYTSDAFEERRRQLEQGTDDPPRPCARGEEGGAAETVAAQGARGERRCLGRQADAP